MNEIKKFWPKEENLGKDCQFWCLRGPFTGCGYPKAEMQGRMSCEGIIDDVCLYLKDRRPPSSLTPEQLKELKTRVPDSEYVQAIPPGDIESVKVVPIPPTLMF